MTVFFFFQAEGGIRDIGVTGVQTCALPIYVAGLELDQHVHVAVGAEVVAQHRAEEGELADVVLPAELGDALAVDGDAGHRSEERRVGKERRSRWSPYH